MVFFKKYYSIKNTLIYIYIYIYIYFFFFNFSISVLKLSKSPKNTSIRCLSGDKQLEKQLTLKGIDFESTKDGTRGEQKNR
jgi:hypothetical protein